MKKTALLLAALALGCGSTDPAPTSTDTSSAGDDASGEDAGDGADSTDGADATDGSDAADATEGSDAADATDGSDGADATDGSDVTDGSDGTIVVLTADQKAILDIAVEATWTLPGLEADATVVWTDMGVPHLYAKNMPDLGRIAGFTVARDRFFFMDLVRRLGLGTITELLGDRALSNDVEARLLGSTAVVDRLYAHLGPDLLEYFEGVAAGINAYIDAVADGKLPPPSELDLAGPLLGKTDPSELMRPWDARDIAAMVAVFMYQTNFETGDVGREAKFRSLPTLFAGATNETLRRSGFLGDVWNDARPMVTGAGSTAGFGTSGLPAGKPGAASGPASEAISGAADRPIPIAMLQRVAGNLDRFRKRFGDDGIASFGSNAWAANSTATADGSAIVAGDGHLSLSVPALTYQIGFDTEVFGAAGLQQIGLMLTPIPIMMIGSNGHVAWSATNPVMDITDWYREELQVGVDGLAASRFQGEWKPLVKHEETFVINDVPFLDSVGRTEKWFRYETFDGRFILEVEGEGIAKPEDAEPGEVVVRVKDGFVIPGDTDGDGAITAISFDHVALDSTQFAQSIVDFGDAKDVYEVRNAMKKFVGAGLLFAAGDSAGNILYSSYQTIPCRGYLEKEGGVWAAGADPTRLLDGTTYGGFHMPTGPDGAIDEVPGQTDPYQCAVPFERMPQSINPPDGIVFTANNDPANLDDDGNPFNDEWYLGGAWYDLRADTIRRELLKAKADGGVTFEDMQRIQANATSRYGEAFVPFLLQAMDAAKAVSSEETDPRMVRLAALYNANTTRFEEVRTRLLAWSARGFSAESGVETFYETPTPDQKQDAIATMIANAWFTRFVKLVWDDEGVDSFRHSGNREKTASLLRFVKGRGPGNTNTLASFDTATEESVFFDRLGTVEVESSDELLLTALQAGLDFLSSDPDSPAHGGFGTPNMGAWIWGLRHVTKFESLIAQQLGGGEEFAFITDLFSISTAQLPLAENIPDGDPREQLKWFPRHGDNEGVDAANAGWSGTDFSNGSGPVMRMVCQMKGDEFSGEDVIPGGQSGLTGTENFADQAKLWLGNKALPMQLRAKDVAAAAKRREAFVPE